MPQVDLASVCGGGTDRKIACETTLPDDGDPQADEQIHHEQQPPQEVPPQPDFPPESFYVSREEELDWIDQNAYIERKDSGKGSTVSHSANLNPNIHPTSSSISSASQRYTSTNVKSKPSIIGLPKPQKATYAEAKFRHHCRPANIHLFPKRSGQGQPSGAGKAAVTVLEPSSPKVSCMGRVKSRKERSRRKKNEKQRRKQQGGDQSSLKRSKSIKTNNQKAGFWTNFRSMFRPKKSGKSAGGGGNKGDEVEVKEKQRKKSRSVKRQQFSAAEVEEEPAVLAPGLGGMNRFTSGRRSAAWAGELEVDGAMSEPLDRRGGGSIWERRSVGPLGQVHVDRRWQAVGPISV